MIASSSLSLRERVRLGLSKRTDFSLLKSKTALLIIDVQTYCCSCDNKDASDYYATHALPQMVSKIQQLVSSFRRYRDDENYNNSGVGSNAGCEVIFTMIQSLTTDGRDVSLDYKLSGPYFASLPKVNTPFRELFLPELQPSTTGGKGDIVIPKTSCSVFVSTNLDYVLRNLHVEQLVVCGQLTEQCVESAVRDAADLGYFVTLVEDACATHSRERHERGLLGVQGFCRILSTSRVLEELSEEEIQA